MQSLDCVTYFRVNGHVRDSFNTYGMVTGMSNGGIALGATLGPILEGAHIDAIGYPWTATGLVFFAWLMVIICISKPLQNFV